MASIKELKKKIKSTEGILKITGAMKLVAGAKLNKAIGNASNARPFRQELNQVIQTIMALCENYTHPFIEKKEKNSPVALLVISSNRGLCGGYNSGLFRKVEEFKAQEKVKLFCMGKKGQEFFRREELVSLTIDEKASIFNQVVKVGDQLIKLFQGGEVGEVAVAYNRFYSALRFVPTVETILPLSLGDTKSVEKEFPFDFKYDTPPTELLDEYIPQVYYSLLMACVLDAIAGEHGARMSAMDNAVSNCKSAISELSLKKNKLRQSAITTELIEVVSGAESLKN